MKGYGNLLEMISSNCFRYDVPLEDVLTLFKVVKLLVGENYTNRR